MEPEFFYALITGTTMAIVISLSLTARRDMARIPSIIRARVNSIRWRKLDKMGLDVVAAIGREVDMAWWDREFDRLIATSVEEFSLARSNAVSVRDIHAPTVAELFEPSDYADSQKRIYEALARRIEETSWLTSGDVRAYSEGGYIEPDQPRCSGCDYVNIQFADGSEFYKRCRPCRDCSLAMA